MPRKPKKRSPTADISSSLDWKPVECDFSTVALQKDGLYGMLGLEEIDGSAYSKLVSQSSDVKTKSPLVTKKEITKPVPKAVQSPKKVSIKNQKGKTAKKEKQVVQRAEDAVSSHVVTKKEALDMSSWSRFSLHEFILQGLSALGFTKPTLVQERCILPVVRDGKDLIASAETGSGKTLAFGLPILQRILQFKAPPNALTALVLCPTRELALQIVKHLKEVSKFTDIKVVSVVGGMAMPKQRRLLSKKPEIVVATPGRLWDLIQEGEPHLNDMSKLKFLVVDEADRMVSTGRFQELDNILDCLRKQRPGNNDFQSLLFSATMTLMEGGRSSSLIDKLVQRIRFHRAPEFVDITSSSKVASLLSECKIECTEDDKDDYLYLFLSRYPGRTLLFVNTIASVRRLHGLLSLLEIPVFPLHAKMQQRQRLKNLDRFEQTDHCVLVCTDVAARGLDIPFVQHVVHYQMPKNSDIYIHRSGRTARAGDSGFSLALVGPDDLVSFHKICATLGRREGIKTFPVQTDMMVSVRKRVNVARKLDVELCEEKKKYARSKWFENAAEELDMILDDELIEKDNRTESEKRAHIRKVERLKSELGELLHQPLLPSRFSRQFATANKELFGTMNFQEVKSNAIAVLEEKKKKAQYPILLQDVSLAKKRTSQDALQRLRAAKKRQIAAK